MPMPIGKRINSGPKTNDYRFMLPGVKIQDLELVL